MFKVPLKTRNSRMLWEIVSAVEGRYVVCCVLENELKKREKCRLETASCGVQRIVVLPAGRPVFGMRGIAKLLDLP